MSRTKKLLSKLYLYGIRGNLLLWLEHYICDRSHKTRVGDSSSSPVDAQFHIHDTGLPQLSQGRDLGVVITSDLSCSLHIQQICVKAHQRANSIFALLYVWDCQIISSCIYCICQTYVGI